MLGRSGSIAASSARFTSIARSGNCIRPQLPVCSQPFLSSPFSSSSLSSLPQRATRAAYYRGGTSRALIFQPKDLPSDRSRWPGLFLSAMGSPDPNGRQLNGMGAGVSSLSKICIVEPSSMEGVDVDYTFVGIGIEGTETDMAGNCGNMSAAVGPYAFDYRLLGWEEQEYLNRTGEVVVNVLNTNTGVVIRSTFEVEGGEAKAVGDFNIDGVGGSGSTINLEFLNPGGSKTGKLLPTGNATDTIEGVRASCVDAANPFVFVKAADVGIEPTILPQDFMKLAEKRALLERIREKGAQMMGLCKSGEEPPRVIPKIAIVSSPVTQTTLSGEVVDDSSLDLVVRFISDLQPHRAIPLTGALGTAAAAILPGTVVSEVLRKDRLSEGMITMGHPSGRIQVSASLNESGDIESASVFRTARRIMEGTVFWNE